MKRIIITLALVCTAFLAIGQNKVLRNRMEIAQVNNESDSHVLEIFYMADENPRTYYLSVGNLGIGGHVVNIDMDPIFELFIPLGNTLDEAIAKMEELKAFYKKPKLSTMTIPGNFAAIYPTDDIITVDVTRRQFIFSKVLEFSIPTPGSETVVRNTHVTKSDFNGLLTGLKIHKKLHPKD